MEYIAVYIKKDFLTTLSVGEMKALFQLLRVQNSLNYHMVKLTESHKDGKNLHSVFQQIEETFIIASMIKEAIKDLFGKGKCLDTLGNLIHTPSIISEQHSLGRYYDDFKTEVNLKFLEMVRNDFSFHFKKSIYDKQITDGTATDDMLLSVSLDETNRSIIYMNPTNAMLDQVRRFFEVHNINPFPVEKYLFDVVYNETIRLYQFVNRFISEVLKGHAYKKKKEF